MDVLSVTGKAIEERRLTTPRPVATSTLVHPVRRKIPQEAFFASEVVENVTSCMAEVEAFEALPAESDCPKWKSTLQLAAHYRSTAKV